MYTQEIICTYCSKMTSVNVTDTKGGAVTPCQKCRYDIVIETDENGKVVSISKKKGCFITTAAVEAAGLPDDCYEVQTLRKFRDNYVRNLPDGIEIISNYYAESPELVRAISLTLQAKLEYRNIIEIVHKAINYINIGKNKEAFLVYKTMVEQLKNKYL